MEFLKKIVLVTSLVLPFLSVAYSMQNRPDFLEPIFRYRGIRKPAHKPVTLIKALKLKSHDPRVLQELSAKILEVTNKKEEKDLKINLEISNLIKFLNPDNSSTVTEFKEHLEKFLQNIKEFENSNSDLTNFCKQIRSILDELNKQADSKEIKKVVLDKLAIEQQPAQQQNLTFWQKHKKKIIIGGCVLGIVIGGAIVAKLLIPSYFFVKCANCAISVAQSVKDLVPVQQAIQPTCPVQDIEMCQAVSGLLTSGQQFAANAPTATSLSAQDVPMFAPGIHGLSSTATSSGTQSNLPGSSFADWLQSLHQGADQQITNTANGLASMHSSADQFLGFNQ
jgi:hypothetical protein